MRFLTWLRSEKRSDPAERRGGPGGSRRRAMVRPRLEVLEERRVLSTPTVTSDLDNPTTVNPGDGTLRGEIAAAQSGDTIVFAPTLNGPTIALGGGVWSQLEINQNLTIQGPGAGILTIYGNSLSGVFKVDAGANVTISGLKLGGGDGEASYYSGNRGFGGTPDYYDGRGGGVLRRPAPSKTQPSRLAPTDGSDWLRLCPAKA
jgi:hypothetical protein